MGSQLRFPWLLRLHREKQYGQQSVSCVLFLYFIGVRYWNLLLSSRRRWSWSVWWIIMEGLRIDKLHQVWEDALGSEHDLTRTNFTFYAGQFLMYTFMMLGTSLEVFDCFDCDCCTKVIVVRKQMIEV